MRVINRTPLSNGWVDDVVKFLVDSKTKKYLKKVSLTNSQAYLCKGYFLPDERRIRVFSSFDDTDFPFWRCETDEEEDKFGYRQLQFTCPEHVIFFTLAHEVRHCWQCYISKKKWLDNAKTVNLGCGVKSFSTKNMEQDADKWAIIKFRQFYGVDITK